MSTIASAVTIEPGMLFEVQEYPLTTFEFGTDAAYRLSHGDETGEPGTPWAFSHAAVISNPPQPKRPVSLHLSFGALLNVPGYGIYRLERDHNRNVKFVAVELGAGVLEIEADRATFLYQWKEGMYWVFEQIAATDYHRAWDLHQRVYMPLASEWVQATSLDYDYQYRAWGHAE